MGCRPRFAAGLTILSGRADACAVRLLDGVAFILGLLQSDFGMIGIDGLSHVRYNASTCEHTVCSEAYRTRSQMVEEIPQPHINVPRAMILAVIVGAGSSFVLLIALLFVMTDINAVISSPAGCLAEICYQATGNIAGAICLQVRQAARCCFRVTI